MSKLISYDWRCLSCGSKYDALSKSSVLVGKCPECGHESKRLISAPTIDPRMGVDPDSSMGDRWARKMEKQARDVKKRQLEHGDDI